MITVCVVDLKNWNYIEIPALGKMSLFRAAQKLDELLKGTLKEKGCENEKTKNQPECKGILEEISSTLSLICKNYGYV